LPAALWERLAPDQQDTLLAHELAHLRRRDHWVRRLELLVLGLYWWHPVVWWGRRQLHEAEEQCCDAWVVWALPAAARAYATALLETVTFLSQSRRALPVTASGAGHVRPLKRRLAMILRDPPSRTLTWGGALVVLALAALLLPLWPTWAEPPRTAPPEPEPRSGMTDPFAPEPTRTGSAGKSEDVTVKTGLAPAARTAQVRALEDEIELLEAQLDLKKAEVEAAETALAGAQKQLKLLQDQYGHGMVSVGEMLKVQSEVTQLEAQLLVKRAGMKEPAVRLKQARRRLEQLTAASPSPAPPVTWEDELVDEAFKDFGPVPQGRVLVHHFGLTNHTKSRIHIASVRASAAFVTATPSQAELAPGQSADILVRVDTGRFVGPKIARVYVAFDRPQPGEVVLQVRATSRGAGDEAKPSDAQKRLQDLENRLKELIKETDALKKQLGPPRPGGMGGGGKEPDTVEIQARDFALPINVDRPREGNIRELVLYRSDDEGKTWTQEARAKPDARQFAVAVLNDGVYWFTVVVVDADGRQTPADPGQTTPGLKVRVNTLKSH
jgi:hypothetical protein